MNLQQSPTSAAERAGARQESETDPHGGFPLIARVGWIVLTLLTVTLNAVMLPRYDAVLQAHCQPGAPCFALQVTPYDRQLLHQFGLSFGFVAAWQVMLDAVSVLVCCALGALLFWRKSADRMALFCAYMLVLFGGASFTSILQETLMPLAPAWFALISTLYFLGQTSFLTFFFLLIDQLLQKQDVLKPFLLPVGLVGALVTLGLLVYEFRVLILAVCCCGTLFWARASLARYSTLYKQAIYIAS